MSEVVSTYEVFHYTHDRQIRIHLIRDSTRISQPIDGEVVAEYGPREWLALMNVHHISCETPANFPPARMTIRYIDRRSPKGASDHLSNSTLQICHAIPMSS